jgi:SOS-response transcriptional repressor LexA
MVEHLETALALPRGTLDSDAPVSEALTHKRGARVNKLSQKETFVANISTGSLRAGNPKGSLRAAHAVPVLTWEQALDPNAMHAETYLPAPITASEGAFYLQVEGPSMQAPAEPTFSEGDLILVEPESDSRAGALVVVSLPDTPLPVFRQLVVEGQRRYLRALNPAWPEPISPLPTDALIIGVVHNKVVRY